jgi:SAM-dependent methyltransferase
MVRAVDLSERGASARRHPWEVVRGAFFQQLLTDHGGAGARRVVDVGAGDSWFGAEIAHANPGSDVVCWDSAYSAAELEDPPAGVTRTTQVPDGRFDLVLLMDVLEHIEDSREFLCRSIRPLLAPGAIVLASVPAHPRLFSRHDTELSHFRRYVPRDLVAEVGILCPVVADGPLFVSLTVPRTAQVLLERVRPRDVPAKGVGDWDHGDVVTRAMETALAADARVCRWLAHRGLPIRGLSHWAVAIDQRSS